MSKIEGCVVALIVSIFLGGLFAGIFIKFDTTRAGEHTGYVTAVQQEGLFFHNYKVFFKTDNQSSQEDTYCVQESDKSLADVLKSVNTNRKLVTIHYEGVRGIGINLCCYQRIMDVEFSMTYGAFYNVKQKVCKCGNKYLWTAASKRCPSCKDLAR